MMCNHKNPAGVFRSFFLSALFFISTYFLSALAVSAASVLNSGIVYTGDGDVVHIDPSGKSSRQISLIKNDLFEPLVLVNRQGVLVGGVAESWVYSEDKTRLIFKLRKNAKWSDGVSLTAHDFVYSFNHWAEGKYKNKPYFGEIVGGSIADDTRPLGVKAIDDYTLEIEGIAPYALDPDVFSFPTFAPLPRHAAPKGKLYWSQWPEHPSNGAYTLEKILPNGSGSYILKPNPHAREGLKGHFDQVVHNFGSWEELAPKIIDGELDVIHAMPVSQTDYMKKNGFEVIEFAQGLYYFAINAKNPRLADRNIRKAIVMAVNTDRIRDSIFHDNPGAETAHSFVPAGFGGVKGNPAPSYNVKAAQELMRQAGYSRQNPLKLTIVSNGRPAHERVIELVKQDLANIFIEVTPDLSEKSFPDYIAKRIIKMDYDIARYGFTPLIQSAKGFLGECQLSAGKYCGGYDAPAFTEKLIQSSLAAGAEEQAKLLSEANDLLLDTYVTLPIVHRGRFFVHSKNVRIDHSKKLVPIIHSINFAPAKIDTERVGATGVQ